MTTEQQLLFNVIRMMDFSDHRTYCSAQEECLFQEIEQYLEKQGIKDYRLNNKEIVQRERLNEEKSKTGTCNKCGAICTTCDN